MLKVKNAKQFMFNQWISEIDNANFIFKEDIARCHAKGL